MSNKLSHFSFRYINKLAWISILAFIAVIFTMEYFSPHILWEGIFISIPLIITALFWSQRTNDLIKKNVSPQKKEAFFQDLFLVTYSFFLGMLLSLLFQYNNSDVKAWWPIAIYALSFYGFIFGILFSTIAMILNGHKIYSILYSFIIFFTLLFLPFWPNNLNVLTLGSIDSFAFIYLLLLSLHFLICFSYKIYKLIILKASF